MADKKPDKADKVFDPFAADPAIVAMGLPAGGQPVAMGLPAGGQPAPNTTDKDKQHFNPDVSPFTPVSELCTWKVIAAEYTGANTDH